MSASLYPYVKVFHVFFVIAWLAGIFYLPRIIVHYVEGRAAGEDVRRLQVMAKKLYHFASVMAVFAIALGIWLWKGVGFTGGWIEAKLCLVVLMIGYHISMRILMKRMLRDAPLPTSGTLRWYNELPVFILLPILWLVILKPF